MKVYRLEHKVFGLGPFTLLRGDAPKAWSNSHVSPGNPISIDFDTTVSWLLEYHPTSDEIPRDFIYSFLTLDQLEEAFPGWRSYPFLKVFEYTIEDEGKNVCIFPSGQVVYDSFTEKRELNI